MNQDIIDRKIKNPFYKNLEENNEVLEISRINGRCLIFCRKIKVPIEITKEIINKNINEEIINEFKKYYTLIECNNKILNNIVHKNHSVIITSDILNKINNNITYNETEVVILMYEFDDISINKLYIDLYKEELKISDMINTIYMMDFYGILDDEYIYKLKLKYKNIQGDNYWRNEYNLNNMNNIFVTRLYYNENIIITTEYTKEYINNLIKMLECNPKIMLFLINKLMISKEYFYLIIKNKYILNIIKKYYKLNETNQQIYKYLFAYSWLHIYKDEVSKNYEHKYLLDLDIVNNLPVFPHYIDKIKDNPYMTVLVDDVIINSKENLLGIPIIDKENNIDTITNFKRKFNIFTIGRPDINILDGYEKENNKWKNIVCIGSVIPACLLKNINYFDLYEHELLNDTAWVEYYNRYYNNSILTIVNTDMSIYDYYNNTLKLFETVKFNVYKKNPDHVINFNYNKIINITVSKDYLSKLFNNRDPNFLDEKNIEIKEKIYEIYVSEKINNNKKMREKLESTNYEPIFKIANIDDLIININHIIYSNHNENDINIIEDNKIVLNINEEIKFKIESKSLIIPIEIINVRKNIVNYISELELGCLRAYYDGNTVNMLPTCVTSLMTFTNIDYKPSNNIEKSIKLIIEYRNRGFGTLLNSKEKELLKKYDNFIQFGYKKINHLENKILKYPELVLIKNTNLECINQDGNINKLIDIDLSDLYIS